jgi:hypothetical protein
MIVFIFPSSMSLLRKIKSPVVGLDVSIITFLLLLTELL